MKGLFLEWPDEVKFLGGGGGHLGPCSLGSVFPRSSLLGASGDSRGAGLRGGATSGEGVRSLNQSSIPDAKGLSNPSEVETLREKVYATLEAYTKQKYPDQPGR